MIDPTAGASDQVKHFVFSPASSYPMPYAQVVDRAGTPVHTWSSAEGQPSVQSEPPSFLRGWNHVEVLDDGHLLATVPLHALLRLDRCSNVVWKAEVSAHHDIAVDPDGLIHVLTEKPRKVLLGRSEFLILDNAITILDGNGCLRDEISIYDALVSDPLLACRLNDVIIDNHERLARDGGSADDPRVKELLTSGTYRGELREALSLLRQLPGSPCDVMHTNTVEVVTGHQGGPWQPGRLLIAVRNLDLVALLDPDHRRVVWWWGPGELSGPHQPTVLPNGNVLIFDNGRAHGRSRVVELDPATGNLVWEYTADPPDSFFSAVASGCEPLPNGNLLVTDAQGGRAFELTREKQVVWEWTTEQLPGAERPSRATLYRMAAVRPEVVERLRA